MEPLVRKRSGKVVPFSRFRIINAIYKAMKATNIGTKADAERVADAVALYLYRQYFKKGDIPHVETIQDVVEKTLMEMGFHEVAKAYILYREKRRQAREIGKALVDGINLIEEYLGEEDWRVKENSNMGFSLQGLNFHVSSSIIARYWLEKLYPEEVARAHKEGDFHIHDLGILGAYCCGWDLYDLLLKGFGGVSGKVESKPPKHFRAALGQIVNFMYTLQGECYSEDTQVLTENGWKYFYEVKPGEKVFTLNPETNEIELQEPYRFYEYDFDGELYHFKGDEVDLLVTPGHRMLVKERGENSFKFVSAQNFDHRNHFLPIWKDKFTKVSSNPGIKKIKYSGKVFCLEVPNHTLYVRRNGKALWCGNCAGAQAFSNFDTLLAPFVRYDKLSYEDVKQCMQEFLFNMNVPTRTGFQVPFTNLTFDLKPSKLFANTNVILGGKPKDEVYEEFHKEMSMINRAFCELMMEGDAKGRIFTFPIPTYNITKDFDWDNPEYEPLWEMTRKYGIPYFANFVNSDMDPEDARSMCLEANEEILIRNSKKIKRLSIKDVAESYKDGEFDEEGWAECKKEGNLEVLSLNPQTFKLEWVPVKRFLKIKDDKAVEVITEDGKFSLFSFKHPVPVYTPEGIKMKFAKDLQKGDYLLTLKRADESIFSKEYQKIEDLVLDEDLAKILGYFVADGNYLFESRKGSTHFGEPRGMQFTFKTGDQKNLEEIKCLIRKMFNLPTYEKQDPRYNTYYLYVYNAEIARKLYRAGFRKYGRLPQILFNSPKSVIESFLEFYFRGDGYERRKEIHLNDLELSRDLVLLFSLIGKPVTYKVEEKSQGIYLQHSKAEVKEKYNAHTEESLKIKNSDIYLVRVEEIKIRKYEELKEFYDIELERNHLFVHSLGQISFNCCRLRLDQRELRKRGGGLFGAAPLTGSIGVVTINLPRIGYLSTCEEEFFERLESLMNLAKISLEIKRKVIEDFTEKGLYPYSKFYLESVKQARGQYWANHFSTIGVVGMNEMCLNFLGKPIYDESAKQFAIKVLKFMRDKLADFQQETGNLYNLEATPAESSLAPDEKVLISQSDPKLKEIGPLIDEYMEKYKDRVLVAGRSEILPLKEGELYTYGFSLKDLKIKKYPVTALIRHPGDSMYEIETVSGRKVKVTKYHSVFTLGEDGLPKKVKVETLKKGDVIAIPKRIEMEDFYQEFNLIEEFKKIPQIRESLYLKTTSDFIEKLLVDERVRSWIREYYQFPFKDVKYQWRKKKVIPLRLIYDLNIPIEREVLKNSEIFYRNSKNTFPIKPLIPINKNFGFLLGAILAEGWIGKDCIKIVNTNQDFIREVTLSAKKVFGSLSLKVTSKERGGRRKPLFVLTLPLLPTLFIREILKLKGKSWQKSVPSFAYFSSKDFVAGLLKGFFMGDGNEYIKPEKRDYKIRLYTNSKELKDGLNLLLLKLGILAKIKEDKKDKTHKNWKRNYILEITGLENLQKFYQLVLDKEFKGKVKNSGREKIPQIIQNLKRLIKNAGLKKEELEDLGIWQGTFDRCVRKNSISLDYLREVIEKLDKRIEDPLLENLKILIEGDLYWDPIKSIKRVEVPEYVYDFEVDVEGDLVQNFLGGEGLVCLHNTAFRLAKIDKKKFPRIKTAGTDSAPYYTNSCHLPVNYTDDIFEILTHQDDLQILFTGGTVVHLFVGEEIADRKIVKDLVRTIVENFRLPYFSITPTFSVCPIHGYLPGKHEFCPYPHKDEEIEKFGIEIEVPLSLLTKLPEKAYKKIS